MKTHQKIMAVATSGLFVFSLVACSNSDVKQTAEKPVEAASSTVSSSSVAATKTASAVASESKSAQPSPSETKAAENAGTSQKAPSSAGGGSVGQAAAANYCDTLNGYANQLAGELETRANDAAAGKTGNSGNIKEGVQEAGKQIVSLWRKLATEVPSEDRQYYTDAADAQEKQLAALQANNMAEFEALLPKVEALQPIIQKNMKTCGLVAGTE